MNVHCWQFIARIKQLWFREFKWHLVYKAYQEPKWRKFGNYLIVIRDTPFWLKKAKSNNYRLDFIQILVYLRQKNASVSVSPHWSVMITHPPKVDRKSRKGMRAIIHRNILWSMQTIPWNVQNESRNNSRFDQCWPIPRRSQQICLWIKIRIKNQWSIEKTPSMSTRSGSPWVYSRLCFQLSRDFAHCMVSQQCNLVERVP